MPAEAQAAPAIPADAQAAVVEAQLNNSNVTPGSSNVAKFAKLLQAEQEAKAPEGDTTIEGAPESGTVQPKPAPKAPAVAIDADAIKKAFLEGDPAELAKLLGIDPKSTKIHKTQWAEWRVSNKQKAREFDQQRAQLDQQKAQLQQYEQQVKASGQLLDKAMPAFNQGDYLTFLELCTGKDATELMSLMTGDLIDPSKKEIRKLRQETEREKATRLQAEQAAQKQQADARAQAETAQYVASLKTELTQDEEISPWVEEYGDEFLAKVFEVQKQNWNPNTQKTLSARDAASMLIENQQKIFARYSSLLERRGIELPTKLSSPTSKDSKPKAKSGPGNAQLTPRKSVVSNQGGAGPSRPWTKDERIAHFARQMRAEQG